MTGKLIETLEKYRTRWEQNPGDPVVYQRHAVSLRRDLARHRDQLKSEAESGPAVATAQSAVAPVKPGTSTSSTVRHPTNEPTTREQEARTAETHLRPDPAAMKKRIEAKRAIKGARATVADRALVLLGEIDVQVAKPQPDRKQLAELFNDLKCLLGQLEEPKESSPSTGGETPPPGR